LLADPETARLSAQLQSVDLPSGDCVTVPLQWPADTFVQANVPVEALHAHLYQALYCQFALQKPTITAAAAICNQLNCSQTTTQ